MPKHKCRNTNIQKQLHHSTCSLMQSKPDYSVHTIMIAQFPSTNTRLYNSLRIIRPPFFPIVYEMVHKWNYFLWMAWNNSNQLGGRVCVVNLEFSHHNRQLHIATVSVVHKLPMQTSAASWMGHQVKIRFRMRSHLPAIGTSLAVVCLFTNVITIARPTIGFVVIFLRSGFWLVWANRSLIGKLIWRKKMFIDINLLIRKIDFLKLYLYK